MDKYLKIKKLFEQQADKENAIAMSKYMRNLFKFYGIPTPKRKAIYKDFLKEEKKLKQVDWDFLDKCYEDDHREFQYLVSDYLITMNQFLNYEDIFKMEKYIKTKEWWDTIDFLDRVIGEIGLRDNRVDKLMLDWSKDDDFWVEELRLTINCVVKKKPIQNY